MTNQRENYTQLRSVLSAATRDTRGLFLEIEEEIERVDVTVRAQLEPVEVAEYEARKQEVDGHLAAAYGLFGAVQASWAFLERRDLFDQKAFRRNIEAFNGEVKSALIELEEITDWQGEAQRITSSLSLVTTHLNGVETMPPAPEGELDVIEHRDFVALARAGMETGYLQRRELLARHRNDPGYQNIKEAADIHCIGLWPQAQPGRHLAHMRVDVRERLRDFATDFDLETRDFQPHGRGFHGTAPAKEDGTLDYRSMLGWSDKLQREYVDLLGTTPLTEADREEIVGRFDRAGENTRTLAKAVGEFEKSGGTDLGLEDKILKATHALLGDMNRLGRCVVGLPEFNIKDFHEVHQARKRQLQLPRNVVRVPSRPEPTPRLTRSAPSMTM